MSAHHGHSGGPWPERGPDSARRPAPIEVTINPVATTGEASALALGETIAGVDLGGTFAAMADTPYQVPAWVRRRAARGRFDYAGDGDRLATCLALMHPKGVVPTRAELASLCATACSIPADDETDGPAILKRAADAAERIFRRGYTIPRHVIDMRRAAMRLVLEETTAHD